MTEDQYNCANRIKSEISGIDTLLEILDCVDDFTFDPPTRQTGFILENIHGEKPWRHLTEGEVACIKEALESKKAILQREFGKL